MRSSLVRLCTVFVLLFIFCTGCADSQSEQKSSLESIELRGLGAAASAFLRPDPYSSLTIEVAYVENHKPTAEALDHLVSFLSERLYKPDGIQVVFDDPLPEGILATVEAQGADPGVWGWTDKKLNLLETLARKRFSSGRNLTAFILFLDDRYYSDADETLTMAISYQSTSIAVFETAVQRLSGRISQPSRTMVEKTLLAHEFGHLLGLVNAGTPMVSAHEDRSNSRSHGHCNNPRCLMYYMVNTDLGLSSLLNGNVPTLDDRCQEDLRAAGGK